MRRNVRLPAGVVLLMAAALFTGCNTDDEFFNEEQGFVKPQTRAFTSQVVTFENATSVELAGPTSYGDNLYSSDPSFIGGWYDATTGFFTAFNTVNGVTEFYCGGIAPSNWNIRSNGTTHSQDWWYSYQNQCSVYNTASTDGANANAGYSGSNFGIVYGYVDQYSSSYMAMPEFTFWDENSEPINRGIQYMYVCNSSYTYGVIINGNYWDDGEDDGWTGEAQSLVTTEGWFKVQAFGYDASGTPTNSGNPVEFYLADYRPNSPTATPAIERWTKWNLSALGLVATIKFNFVGSDTSDYGLNTPAYVCIDDITFE
jgi:hypothetical protein